MSATSSRSPRALSEAGSRVPGAAPDVAVIGGGIVGTSAAAFLAEAGLRVLLVERVGLASGASGANSGVVQHPFDPVLAPLYDETVRLYRALTGMDAGFRLPDEPAGLLFVSRDRGAAERLAASIAASYPDERPEVLAGAELQAIEPALHPDLVACRVRNGHPVPPAASTYAYATVAERHGVTIRLGREAAPEIVGGRVVGVRIDGVVEPTGAILVACGPWTPAVIDPTGRWRPIRPMWGVVVEAELAAPPRYVLEEAEIDAVLALGAADGEAGGPPAGPGRNPSLEPGRPVPSEFSLCSAGGISAVGSTFLRDEPDPAVWLVPLLVRGSTFVPAIAQAPIRGVRVCARPLSLDGRPLIGRLPGVAGLHVCAGHGPWGISTGPASARLVADLMLGRPAVLPEALDAARFGSPFER